MKNFTTLILLNDLKDTLTLKKGLELAKEDNSSVLVLYVYEKEHYSLEDLLFFDDNSIDKESIKKKIKKEIKKLNYQKDVAILVYQEDSEDRILSITKNDSKYRVVIPYHKEITKRIVSKVDEEIFIIKSSANEYKNIAIIVDGLKSECIDRYIDKKLTLLYDAYIEYDAALADPVAIPDINISNNLIDIEESNFKELKNRYNINGEFFINGAGLIDYIKDNDFDLIIICKEIKDAFGLDSIYEELLDVVNCDILIVDS